MNKPVKLACVVAAAMLAAPMVSFSQTAPADKAGYVVSPDRTAVKNGSGLCWRTGFWTPADAFVGCDDDLLPKAPPPPPAPPPAPAPPPP
ncbi:MAG: OmpA family protein, partial [Burkholderiales bacterium]